MTVVAVKVVAAVTTNLVPQPNQLHRPQSLPRGSLVEWVLGSWLTCNGWLMVDFFYAHSSFVFASLPPVTRKVWTRTLRSSSSKTSKTREVSTGSGINPNANLWQRYWTSVPSFTPRLQLTARPFETESLTCQNSLSPSIYFYWLLTIFSQQRPGQRSPRSHQRSPHQSLPRSSPRRHPSLPRSRPNASI